MLRDIYSDQPIRLAQVASIDISEKLKDLAVEVMISNDPILEWIILADGTVILGVFPKGQIASEILEELIKQG